VRDKTDFNTHMDYVHFNPIKQGSESVVAEWPYSTFHRLVEPGVYLKGWAESNGTGLVYSGQRCGAMPYSYSTLRDLSPRWNIHEMLQFEGMSQEILPRRVMCAHNLRGRRPRLLEICLA